MDIKDIRQGKRLLEEMILESIRDFEERTSCSVSDIDLIFSDTIGGMRNVISVNLDIRIL